LCGVLEDDNVILHQTFQFWCCMWCRI